MANFGKVWRKLTTPFGRQEESKHHPYRHPSHFTDLDRERALAARVPSGNAIYLSHPVLVHGFRYTHHGLMTASGGDQAKESTNQPN